MSLFNSVEELTIDEDVLAVSAEAIITEEILLLVVVVLLATFLMLLEISMLYFS